VLYEGVRYVAPNDNGRRGYIQAWDAKSNLLWSVTIFRNFINPLLEEDVQWVYIKTMSLNDGKLMVTDERGRSFSVDLKRRAVRRLPKPIPAIPKANQSRQPTPGVRLAAYWASSARRGCAYR
jgi:hypothetical protein